MNLTVLATGSRGDVQPFVALAWALARAGHAVKLVTNAVFAGWARGYGLEVREIAWDPVESMRRQPDMEGLNPLQVLQAARKIQANNRQVLAQVQRECWECCQDASLLIYSALAPWGQAIAEKLRIPAVPGLLHPMLPTRAFPMQMIPANLGGPLNLASHSLGDWAMDALLGGLVNSFRRELGLAPIRLTHSLAAAVRAGGPSKDGPSVDGSTSGDGSPSLDGGTASGGPLLLALSTAVIPRPPDWPARAHMAGFWYLPASPGWSPPPALANFLARGPAVYIGFGSMAHTAPGEVLRITREALGLAGLRGILAAGWSGLEEAGPVDDRLLVIDQAPHDWLFERAAAVVHHGGAGTTAAGLRAGKPAVIVPHMQDQFYWAARLHALGAVAEPLPRRRLSAQALAERLHQALAEPVCQRAARLGEQIRAEPGVQAMVEVVEEYAMGWKS